MAYGDLILSTGISSPFPLITNATVVMESSSSFAISLMEIFFVMLIWILMICRYQRFIPQFWLGFADISSSSLPPFTNIS